MVHDRTASACTVDLNGDSVVDLGDIESGRMITIGGQSGHVGSPHYDDLTPLWLEGRTVPMRLETLPADAKILHLRPA